MPFKSLTGGLVTVSIQRKQKPGKFGPGGNCLSQTQDRRKS
jgi:hypothetical protein